MLKSETKSAFFYFYFFLLFFYLLSVRYSILPGAVWCGAGHTCSHTHFVDRCMMSEGGDTLSLPFTSKTGESHSVAQNVTNIIAEPKYKYGQQEQVTARNHNRSTALELSV